MEAAAAAADEGKEGDGDAEKEGGGEEVDDDYQLDHTIITYYMGPDGKIIEYYGFDVRAEYVDCVRLMTRWERKGGRGAASLVANGCARANTNRHTDTHTHTHTHAVANAVHR